MLSGMDNCTESTDVDDEATDSNHEARKILEDSYCFSHHTKAALLGAYFYGHLAQFIFIFLAHRIGYTAVTRVAIFLCGALQIVFPVCLLVSPYLNVGLQGLRGAIAGVIVPHIMDFVRKWGLSETETKRFISVIGVIIIVGASFGPTIAGTVGGRLGWEYYFYISGAVYFFMLVIMLLFIPSSPLEAYLMSDEEKNSFKNKINVSTRDTERTIISDSKSQEQDSKSQEQDSKTQEQDSKTQEQDSKNESSADKIIPENNYQVELEKTPVSEIEELSQPQQRNDRVNGDSYISHSPDGNAVVELQGNAPFDRENSKINGLVHHDNQGNQKKEETDRASLKDIFSRTYLYAFCVYAFCSSFTYYTSIMTAPFYLREVLGASLDLIALWSSIMGMAGQSTLTFYKPRHDESCMLLRNLKTGNRISTKISCDYNFTNPVIIYYIYTENSSTCQIFILFTILIPKNNGAILACY